MKCESGAIKENEMKSFHIVLRYMIIAVIAFAFVVGCKDNRKSGPNSDPQKNGYVPDAETAIAVAVAVWNPIYGKEQIEKEKPYKASLSNGVWTVEGSLPEGHIGGVAEIDISKDDCKILRVIHGK
jgi:hypothetical protein